MNASTSKKGDADQAYKTMASTTRSKNSGSVFGTRNRSLQVNTQLSRHTDRSNAHSNLLNTGKNILSGNGQDDKMSTTTYSQAPPIARAKGRNNSSK